MISQERVYHNTKCHEHTWHGRLISVQLSENSEMVPLMSHTCIQSRQSLKTVIKSRVLTLNALNAFNILTFSKQVWRNVSKCQFFDQIRTESSLSDAPSILTFVWVYFIGIIISKMTIGPKWYLWYCYETRMVKGFFSCVKIYQ